MAMTVTATQQSTPYEGMSMTLKVLTGAAASQPGATAGNQTYGAPQQQAITPQASGSLVYGAMIGFADGTFVALASTTFAQHAEVSGVEAAQFRSASVTTASTPVTLGCNGTNHGAGISLAEILASGTLAEDASSPSSVAYNAFVTTLTTAAFTPPAGSLLVLSVAAVGSIGPGSGVTTISVTDTSGLGLAWTERFVQNGAGFGYAGVWTTRYQAKATAHTRGSVVPALIAMGGPA